MALAMLTENMHPVVPELNNKKELVLMEQLISAQMMKRKGSSLVRPQGQIYQFVVRSKHHISSS
jgi:hypothetical protein